MERAFLVAVALWAIAIFLVWPSAYLAKASIYSEPIIGVGQANFSNVTSWMPLASEVARGNLFPIDPLLGQGASGLSFYPYVTLWIHGATIFLFDLDGAYIFGSTIWPATAFFLLVVLYRRYLPRRWAITLAAVGSIAFVDFPLRQFLLDLFSGTDWRELGVVSMPELAGFPIPSLTVACFLATLLMSLQRLHLSQKRLTILTVLWALQFQIHPVNAAVGLVFWFTHFPSELLRHQRGSSAGIWRKLVIQGSLALFVCAPAVFGWINLTTESVDFLGRGHQAPEGLFSIYYFFAYFVLPLALLGSLYVVMRLDYYELLTKFRPIYTLMVVEFVLVTTNLVTDLGIPAENIFSRLALYVLHPLYYVPFIHFLTRTQVIDRNELFSQGSESTSIATFIRRMFHWGTMEASKVYLPLLFLLVTSYAAVSAFAHWQHVEERMINLRSDAADVAKVAARGAERNTVIATEHFSANFLLPLVGRHGSLFGSRFANTLQRHEAIERLALYARLAGWTEETFQIFMAPAELRDIAPLKEEDRKSFKSIGYWLIHHLEIIRNGAELAAHRQNMSQAFKAVSINYDSCRFGLRRWLSSSRTPAGLKFLNIRETNQGRLHILPWTKASVSLKTCLKGEIE